MYIILRLDGRVRRSGKVSVENRYISVNFLCQKMKWSLISALGFSDTHNMLETFVEIE